MKRWVWAICAVLGLSLAACGPAQEGEGASEESQMEQPISIAEAIAKHGERLVAMDGISMVSEGLTADGKPCIKIGLVEENPELEASLPKELEGWPVEIEISGEIRPMH